MAANSMPPKGGRRPSEERDLGYPLSDDPRDRAETSARLRNRDRRGAPIEVLVPLIAVAIIVAIIILV